MEIQANKSKLTVVAEESYQNIRTVKAFANEDEESKKFAAKNLSLFATGRTKALVTAFQTSLTQITLYGTLCAILYCSKILFEKGKIEIGSISTFMLYILSLIF